MVSSALTSRQISPGFSRTFKDKRLYLSQFETKSQTVQTNHCCDKKMRRLKSVNKKKVELELVSVRPMMSSQRGNVVSKDLLVLNLRHESCSNPAVWTLDQFRQLDPARAEQSCTSGLWVTSEPRVALGRWRTLSLDLLAPPQTQLHPD